MLVNIPSVEAVLHDYAEALGDDLPGYRNHVYRVVNFCQLLLPDDDMTLQKISIAAAFHDLGIWTAGTFDYLPSSHALAQSHLEAIGRMDWSGDIRAMIEHHHGLSRCDVRHGPVAEAFRRADWIDVSAGFLRFGLTREVIRRIRGTFPDEGFHAGLLRRGLHRAVTDPFDPLPMLRR